MKRMSEERFTRSVDKAESRKLIKRQASHKMVDFSQMSLQCVHGRFADGQS